MKKMLLIETCKECMYLDDSWGLLDTATGEIVAQIGQFFCTHSEGQRMCDNINIIPNWCPLPDSKEREVLRKTKDHTAYKTTIVFMSIEGSSGEKICLSGASEDDNSQWESWVRDAEDEEVESEYRYNLENNFYYDGA